MHGETGQQSQKALVAALFAAMPWLHARYHAAEVTLAGTALNFQAGSPVASAVRRYLWYPASTGHELRWPRSPLPNPPLTGTVTPPVMASSSTGEHRLRADPRSTSTISSITARIQPTANATAVDPLGGRMDLSMPIRAQGRCRPQSEPQ